MRFLIHNLTKKLKLRICDVSITIINVKMSFVAITELDNLIMSSIEIFYWSNIARINKASYDIMCAILRFCE